MGSPIRILYVDDDVGLGILLRKSLAPHGYVVDAVETGEDALAKLAYYPYDVVALDHNLTNEIGLNLIPQIHAKAPSLPILYVTGSDDARVAVAALKAGAVDYVWKDVEGHYRELLVQAIQAAIEQARMKREADEAQRQIREARDRAEMLLREVNHRVANSLAMVSSLIQLQSHAVTDRPTRDLLHETQARIKAIAGVHRRLYTSDDVRSVELNSYLSTLVEDIASSMPGPHRPIRFIPSHENVALPTDKAVALGVIVTELVTNAQKYAYGDGQAGEIRVRIVAAYSTRTVSVEDDGIGWRGQGQIRGSGLGSRIIKGMAQNLQTDVVYEHAERGTRAVIAFAG